MSDDPWRGAVYSRITEVTQGGRVRSRGEFDDDTRAAIERRNNGRCQRCNRAPVEHWHHRKPRGMGGVSRSRAMVLSAVSNGIGLCGGCHVEVETKVRDEAIRDGLILRGNRLPDETPARIYVHGVFGYWRLDNRGGIERVND